MENTAGEFDRLPQDMQDELALIAKFFHHPIVKLAIQLCDEDVSYEELVQRVRQEESLKDLDGRDIEFVNRFVSDFTSQQLGLAGAAVIPEMHKLATVLTHELSMLRFTEHISESALATGLQMLATKEFSAATKCCIRAIETLPSDKPELEPRAYNYLGIAYYRQGKIDSAIQNYKQAIQVSERLGEKYWRSKALGNLGMAYQDLGSIDSALKFYEDALEISRELKDRWEEGRELECIGSLYEYQGNVTKAIERYQESLAISRSFSSEFPDRRGEAGLLNKLGCVSVAMGETDKAVEYFSKSHEILANEVSDRNLRCAVLTNLAGALWEKGESSKADNFYRRATELAFSTEVDDRRVQADVLIGIGTSHYVRGEHDDAVSAFSQALEIYREWRDPRGELLCLGNMAAAMVEMNQTENAIDHADQGLTIAREIKYPWGEAFLLSVMANAYLSVGLFAESWHHFSEAIKKGKDCGDKKTESEAWSGLGLIARYRGNLDEAEKGYTKGQKLSRAIGARRSELADLVNLGTVFIMKNDVDKAQRRFRKALKLSREVGHPWAEAASLINFGYIAKSRNKDLAVDYYNQAAEIADSRGFMELLFRAHFGLGRLYKELDVQRAYDYFDKAIRLLEQMRAGYTEPDFRMGVLFEKERVFDDMVELLVVEPLQTNTMGKGFARAHQLFRFVEMAKSRVLLDLLGSRTLRPSEADGQDADVEEEQRLHKQLEELFNQVRGQSDISAVGVRLPTGTRRKPKAGEEARKNYLETLSEHRRLVTRLKQRHANWASLQYLESSDLSEIQQLIPEDAALLNYYVTPSELVVVVLDRSGAHIVCSKFSDVTRDKTAGTSSMVAYLHGLISKVRSSVAETSKNKDNGKTYAQLRIGTPADQGFWAVSQPLYEILIQPLEPFIEDKHSLIICAHRDLHLLPFQLLWDGEQYMIEKYTISYLPNAGTLKYVQTKSKGEVYRNALILGASKAEGEAYRNRGFGILPFVKGEVENIASLFGIRPYIDSEATATLVKKEGEKCDVLHFACHGDFAPENVRFSALCLAPSEGDSGRLTVHEIMEELRLEKADLVALSACDLGISHRMPGDELLGMTRAFIYSGAPRIVVSLWQLADVAAAELMVHFYKNLQAGMSKTGALREAQLSMLRKAREARQKLASKDPSQEVTPLVKSSMLSDPYFWAPFVLTGNPN